MNDKVMIYFCFLITLYAFFMLNPFSILDYFYSIITLLSITLIFYLTFHLKEDPTINIKKIILYFFYAIIMFAFVFLCFIILRELTHYYSTISFSSVLLLYIIIFSVLYVYYKPNITIDNIENLKDVIVYLLFFIPCILIDFIKFISKDIQETNKNTFILFIFLVAIICIYVIYPYLNFGFSDRGIQLIKHKHSLNESIITYDLEQIQEMIENNRYFWESNMESYSSISSTETQNFIHGLNQSFNNIQKFVLNQSLMYKDNLNDLVDKYKDKPDKLKQEIQQKINQSFYLKFQYYLEIIKQKLFISNKPNISLGNIENKLYTYHYGISFWLYLDTNMLNNKENKSSLIMSIGSRPSLYFDHLKKQLYVEIYDYVDKEKNIQQKRIYKTKNILYQKWNHVVMNYVNGQFDLFINNQLVHSQSNVTPYINKDEELQVGSIENPDIGGISNMVYYDQPLSLSKINHLYYGKKID